MDFPLWSVVNNKIYLSTFTIHQTGDCRLHYLNQDHFSTINIQQHHWHD